jgi:hypothetical protein
MGILIADPRLRGALGPLALGERVCQGYEIPYFRYWMKLSGRIILGLWRRMSAEFILMPTIQPNVFQNLG